MPLEWLYGQKTMILPKNNLDFSENIKNAKDGSKMGRHEMLSTSSDPEFNSGSDVVLNVPWGPQKRCFLEDCIL